MVLRYVGRVEGMVLHNDDGSLVDLRMWDVFAPATVYHKSTLTLDGLKEAGLL